MAAVCMVGCDRIRSTEDKFWSRVLNLEPLRDLSGIEKTFSLKIN